MNKDRIEKQTLLRAPLARVWQALTDFKEFGQWFGMHFDAPFQPGARMKGIIIPTVADHEVAKLQEPYRGKVVEITVEKLEPERLFSFRWHPHAIDAAVDYSGEPTTLIEFHLEQTAEGVLLKVTESGFDQIPLARRAQAFQANDGGWAMQMVLIGKYLATHAQ